MKLPALITTEKEAKSLVLIVDKIGVIGERLSQEFSKDFLVVFVSTRPLTTNNGKIIHIPFKRRIPQVPDNNYSKIFIIDDGNDVTRESTFSFIEKAKLINSKVYFIGSTRNVDVVHADEISSSYINVKVLVFGDLFDKDITFDKDSSISRFINQAKKDGKIQVEGNGLELNYPISFSDTIKLIIKASYLEISQKVILLFYPYPITDISLANTFQKIDPNISVDFVKKTGSKKIYIPKGAQHAIGKYDIYEKLKEINLANSTGERDNNLKIYSKKNEKSKNNFLKPVLFFLLACIFLFLIPLISTSAYLFLGQRQIREATNFAEQGNFKAALKKSNNAQTFFLVAEKTSIALESQAKIFKMQKKAEEINLDVESGKDLARVASSLFEGAVYMQDIYLGKSMDAKKDFSKAVSSFKSADVSIQKIQAQGKIPDEFNKKLTSILPVVKLFSNTSEVLPSILGFDNEKTYLVLIQNNMELRPGGGSINSVAEFSIKDAKITKFEIIDMQKIDEKLETHIEPPFEVRRYLESIHLSLRDSNFSPDFIKNAIMASSLYKLETGKEVDGVIGLDTVFINNLIKAKGDVVIEEEKITINNDNFYEILMQKFDKQIAEEKTKDVLGVIMESIVSNPNSKNNTSYASLIENIGDSVSQKHLLLAFKNPDHQNVFTASNWSGAIVDNRKYDKNIINDYFGISESNLGKDKINYYISRSVSKKVTVENDGKINSTATIAFKNSKNKDSMGGGVYRNYMRLILPNGSRIKEVSVGGKAQEMIPAITDFAVYEKQSFSPSSSFEVEQGNEGEKTTYGFFITVAPESVKTVKISYTIPYVILDKSKQVRYSLLVYKQPGLDSYPFDLLFSIPGDMQVLPQDSESYEINRDNEMNFIFSQK